MAQALADLRHLNAGRVGNQERRRAADTGHHPTNLWNDKEVDITNRNTTLVWGHKAVSQHRIRPRQADAGSLVRSTRSRRRYLRSALTVGEHQRTLQAAAPPPQPGGASWRLVAQALAGLHPDERLTLQLRFLDAQPREAAARLMDCSVWTVSDRQRRALRRLADRLTAGPDTTDPGTAGNAAQPVAGHTT